MAGVKLLAENITEQLRRWTGGKDVESADVVLNLVYDELHRQAHRYLNRERSDHTLQTTALVNEVDLKLVKQEHFAWENRSHFLAIAAKLMRQILIGLNIIFGTLALAGVVNLMYRPGTQPYI